MGEINVMASKKVAIVDKNICVACGACTKVCPRAAITVIKGCYAKADPTLCIGCGLCNRTCPASCITVTEREEK